VILFGADVTAPHPGWTRDDYLAAIHALVWVAVILAALILFVAICTFVLKVIIYIRMMGVMTNVETLLRLSQAEQHMARQQKEKAAEVLTEVKHTVAEVKSAVDGGSQSGTRLPTVKVDLPSTSSGART